MTEEVKAFIAEIEGVCRKHGLQLAVSDYDALIVWKLDPRDELLYASDILDRSGE